MSTTGLDGNSEAIEAWNTVLFEKFIKYRPFVSTALGAHGDRAMERLAPRAGTSVVDIGCGFGDTTLQLGQLVGAQGRAVGVDAAPRFIELCRREAAAAGRENVSYEVADVERGVPGGPYDCAFSRMGTMFFASPVFALRNVRKVLKPGGRMAMVVWRKKDQNACFYDAEVAVRALLGDPPKNDQVTCGPGPFSMASADLVSDQMKAAGWTNIAFERSDADTRIGNTIAEAIDFSLTLGPAGEIVRLAGQAAIDRRGEIETALRKVVEPFVRADGVFAPSSCWLVTATAPAAS